jgi:acyl-CoA dehydrogenase
MRDGGLFGAKQPVADGCVAHVAIVAARGGDAAVGAYLVGLDQTGIARVAIRELDAAGRTARLYFDGAACEPLPGADWPALAAALDRAAVCAAFEQLGRAERAIDQNRRQFFQ